MPLAIKQVLVEKLSNELSFFLSDSKPDVIAGKHSSSNPLMTRPTEKFGNSPQNRQFYTDCILFSLFSLWCDAYVTVHIAVLEEA